MRNIKVIGDFFTIGNENFSNTLFFIIILTFNAHKL